MKEPEYRRIEAKLEAYLESVAEEGRDAFERTERRLAGMDEEQLEETVEETPVKYYSKARLWELYQSAMDQSVRMQEENSALIQQVVAALRGITSTADIEKSLGRLRHADRLMKSYITDTVLKEKYAKLIHKKHSNMLKQLFEDCKCDKDVVEKLLRRIDTPFAQASENERMACRLAAGDFLLELGGLFLLMQEFKEDRDRLQKDVEYLLR